MAYSLVQNPTAANGGGTSIAKAFSSNVVAGNTLVAFATTDPTLTTPTAAPVIPGLPSARSSTRWLARAFPLACALTLLVVRRQLHVRSVRLASSMVSSSQSSPVRLVGSIPTQQVST